MEEKFDFENVKNDIREKANAMFESVQTKASQAVQWGIDNPEKIIAFIGATAALMKASQSLMVNHRLRSERARIDHTYYDPSTGFHWDLCRKATNNDRIQIMSRRTNGEDIYNILRDLKLIK